VGQRPKRLSAIAISSPSVAISAWSAAWLLDRGPTTAFRLIPDIRV
jgi:hypothetical protein